MSKLKDMLMTANERSTKPVNIEGNGNVMPYYAQEVYPCDLLLAQTSAHMLI